jgi:hypothetical protein
VQFPQRSQHLAGLGCLPRIPSLQLVEFLDYQRGDYQPDGALPDRRIKSVPVDPVKNTPSIKADVSRTTRWPGGQKRLLMFQFGDQATEPRGPRLALSVEEAVQLPLGHERGLDDAVIAFGHLSEPGLR